MKILVVEDEPMTREIVVEAVSRAGITVSAAAAGDEAWHKFRTDPTFDVVISDWFMPGIDGLDLCRRIREHDKETYTYFILLTVAAGRDNRVHALEEGVDDFLSKPLDPSELEIRLIVAARVTRLRRAILDASERVALLEEQVKSRRDFEGMVGKSAVMQEVFRRIRLAAQSNASVFIHGDSGTGKELAAKAIHTQSRRRSGPFIAVNCAAIPTEIMESELFGHTKGAFTGAIRDKPGLMEVAHRGTILLDEVGDLAPALQSKLLRFLEDRRIRRVGEEEDRDVDVRVVTATHRDLATLIREGTFREDLYYRIRVFQIDLPRLADRREDLPILIDHFVLQFAKETERPIQGVDNEVMRRLLAHEWPGNIRELRNAIEHAFVVADGSLIHLEDLPAELIDEPTKTSPVKRTPAPATEIIRVIEESDGNRAEAARRLGISRVALWKRIRKLGIEDQLPPGRGGRPS